MAEIVVGPVTEVVKCVAPFMKRQFKYLCCFDANVESLNKEANDLEYAREMLQSRVDAAERDGLVIYDHVKACLEGVRKIQQKKRELDTEIERIRGGGCISIRSRYSASREAVKTAATMNLMQEDAAAITEIAPPPPPAAAVPDTLERPMSEFESRKKIEQDLMELLIDEKVKIVGICGMGGVGKTTLAYKIRNRVLEEKVFGECVKAVVSRPVNKERIQEDIAAQLGLTFKEHERGLLSRAASVRRRLSGNKILILLDDVWEHLDLKELGIPCGPGGGCTILLTSRNMTVFTSMDIDEANVLKMQILTEEEAWSLFKEKVGTCADQFPSLALQVANECKRLPLALTSVAGALKNEKNESVWRSALQQLKSSNPEDLPDVLENVYNPLKLSYGYLRSENAKLIFLLCALFPEDFNIPLRDLTAYVMGLRMFKDIGDLEHARDRTKALVKMLKSQFLLLEGWDEDYVRMHDIVRDVAIFIASKENPLINSAENPLIKCGYDSFWISPFVGGERIELSRDSIFPKLRLLMIDNESAIEKLQVSDIYFEGMKELNVLSIRWNDLFTSFSLSQNLKTLILHQCKSLKTISVVGELINLETLICFCCNAVEEFPSGILKGLRLLEISFCNALGKIGSAREVSCLDNNFGHQNRHITLLSRLESLRLQSLSNLTVFYEGIESIEFPRLTELVIWDCLQLKGVVSSPERVGMEDNDHSLHLFCKQKVSFGKLKKLRLQEITKCNMVFCCSQVPVDSFTHLQEIHLHDLPKLENFCNSAPEFPQLVKLSISFCHEMRSFNSGSITTPNMKSLESLVIRDCRMMEHVFLWSKEEENEEEIVGQSSLHITFPKLTTLELIRLPKLTSLYRTIESIEFPLTTQMDIPFSATTCLIEGDSNNKGSIQLTENKNFKSILCCQISSGSFVHLEKLIISSLGIKSLFPVSVAQNLESLKRLTIGDCKEIVKVIEEEWEGCSHDTSLVFPHLKELTLHHLPKLKTFCKYALGLLKLVEVKIKSCPELVRFGSLSTSYPKSLESFEIRSCSKMETLFLWSKEESIEQTITLPNLTTLCLSDLPQLRNIYEGVESIEFPFPTQMEMEIKNCPNLQESLVCARTLPSFGDIDNKVSFGIMRKQEVKGHTNFVSVWCSQISSGSFTHLEELVIMNIGIKSLFPVSMAQNLESLKLLRIESCKEMVKVIEEEEGEEEHSHDTSLLFPHLKELTLCNLPNLKTFCKYALGLQGVENIGFPLPTRMEIKNCPNLKSLVSTTNCSSSGNINKVVGEPKEQTLVSYSSNFSIWDQIPIQSFNRLRHLTIYGYDEISSLFSSSVAAALINLKFLKIGDCKNMTTVIEREVEEYSNDQTTPLFPHLEHIRFERLPELKIFCEWGCALELPSLYYMAIYSCRKMERFSLGSLTTPILIHIQIDYTRVAIISRDLNHALQQHFINREKSTLSEGQEGAKEEESTSSKGKIVEEEEPTLNDSQEDQEVKNKTEEEQSTLSEGQESPKKKDKIEEESTSNGKNVDHAEKAKGRGGA